MTRFAGCVAADQAAWPNGTQGVTRDSTSFELEEIGPVFVETNKQGMVGDADSSGERTERDSRISTPPMKMFHDMVILVVEDDDDARELMQAVLEQRGARVFAADRVSVAIELFDQVTPEIVVSDIAMPDEDGYSFVRRIRALPPERGGRTPCIAVSAYAGSADRARALAAGFDRYHHKPVDFEALGAAISALTTVRAEDKATA